MAKNKKSAFIRISHYSFLLILGIFGCASMKTPEGGPRDTSPPKVLKMEPKDLSTNFKAKKIIISFDENIKLANEFKEFSISPETDKQPILKVKLKNLEVTLPDSLEQNTTYTLNFGKAIADINEGNPIKNFTYVFSTGPILDSLSISGNVSNALTGKPELDAVVMLLPLARDTLFGKRKATIYATTDSSGNYTLSNLRKDTYKVYAIKEGQTGDKIYQQFTDEVGFIKEPVVLDKNITGANMVVFKELASLFRITDRKLNNDGSITMAFNQKLRTPTINVVDPVAIDANKKVRWNKTNDSVKVWLNNLDFDSIKVAIKDDNKVLETIKFTRGKRDTYTRNVQAGDNLEGGLLNPNRDLRLYFNFPIENLDLTKISLLEDSIPRTGFKIEKDSTDFLAYTVKYAWKKNEPYILKLAEGAATALFNAKNKEINKSFKLGNADDYGVLYFNVKVPDSSKNYILEIVNEKKDAVVASKRIYGNEKITFDNLRTGIYYARVIYDDNKNGTWNTGNVSKGIQPEKIWYWTKEASIKANWRREDIIDIPKE